jgi:glycosyltransferase involved in cell wall biosynthesis
MKKYIIIHDKLLDYGGAESVLLSLIRYKRPEVVICSCVSDQAHWEKLLGVKIVSPKLNSFIHNQFLFKLLYPYIILVCFLSRLAFPYRDAFIVVYSSSAGKYFRGFDYERALVYINFHAKGISQAEKYISRGWAKYLVKFFFIRRAFVFIEDLALKKFFYFRAISLQALDSLPNYLKSNTRYDVGVLHCPSFNSDSDSDSDSLDPKAFKLPSEYFVIISRLNPEKSIEPLLDFINVNMNINIVVIGDGDLKDYFSKKFGSKFHFLGFLETQLKNFIIEQSVAVIQPTSQEWSLITVESNIIGIPVISIHSRGLEEINFTISGFANFPNILFKDYTELPLLVSHINSSANYIKENRDRIISLFSESSFFERLNILENKIFNEKS